MFSLFRFCANLTLAASVFAVTIHGGMRLGGLHQQTIVLVHIILAATAISALGIFEILRQRSLVDFIGAAAATLIPVGLSVLAAYELVLAILISVLYIALMVTLLYLSDEDDPSPDPEEMTDFMSDHMGYVLPDPNYQSRYGAQPKPLK